MASMMCSKRGCARPRHFDQQSGVQHDFCGRTCATAALGGALSDPHGCCHTCKLGGCSEPVFFEPSNGRVHDFCSRGHADEAVMRGEWPGSARGHRASGGRPRCGLPGCNAPRFVDPGTDVEYDFCGRTHAKLAESRGLLAPPANDPRFDRVFKGTQGGGDYTLSVLTRRHEKYDGVKQQFLSSWEHPGPKPVVQRILQIRNSPAVFEAYSDRQDAMRGAGSGAADNELRRFHGTSSLCNFPSDQGTGPCHSPNCRQCRICCTSFELAQAGSGAAVGWAGGLRYGAGLYFSKVSSKSNDYAGGTERVITRGLALRSMFLCKVLAGSVARVTADSLVDPQRLQQIKATYDSLEGLTQAQGGALNYPETVIYDAAQCIPSYLIVYKV